MAELEDATPYAKGGKLVRVALPRTVEYDRGNIRRSTKMQVRVLPCTPKGEMMKFLDSLLNVGTHFTPWDLPPVVPLSPVGIDFGSHLPPWEQRDMFMSAVERQRCQDMLFLMAGACFPTAKFTFLTPLQKTAYAYWRDTTDLQFPGATPIQIEILRELRRLNAGI